MADINVILGWSFVGLFLSSLVALGIFTGIIPEITVWVRSFIDKYWSVFNDFIKTHKWLQIIYFLLIILVIGNTLVPFMLGFFVICDEDDTAYIPDNLVDSLMWRTGQILYSVNSTWFEAYAGGEIDIKNYGTPDPDNSLIAEKSFDIIGTGCYNQKATIKLFNRIPAFDYQIWLLLIVIGYIFIPFTKWYLSR